VLFFCFIWSAFGLPSIIGKLKKDGRSNTDDACLNKLSFITSFNYDFSDFYEFFSGCSILFLNFFYFGELNLLLDKDETPF